MEVGRLRTECKDPEHCFALKLMRRIAERLKVQIVEYCQSIDARGLTNAYKHRRVILVHE